MGYYFSNGERNSRRTFLLTNTAFLLGSSIAFKEDIGNFLIDFTYSAQISKSSNIKREGGIEEKTNLGNLE